MNAKTVAILAVVAVVLIVAAAFISRRDRVETPVLSETTKPALFPGLVDKLPSVAEIEVKHADKQFTVRKNAQGAWEIADKGGYPAKPDTVKVALNGLALLQKVDPMTERPDRYSQIGVQDVDGKPNTNPAPTQVTLKDDKGQPIISAIIGNQKFEGNKRGVYIREAGQKQSWLADGEAEVPEDPIRWIDPNITQITRERIKGVTVTQPDNSETLVISRANDKETNFTVHDLPKGKELKSASEPDALASALSYLSLEDVAPIGSVDFKGGNGFKAGAHSEFRTFDGLVIACDLAEKDGKTWASFAANFEPPANPTPAQPEAKPEGDQKDEKAADKKPGEKSPDQVKKEVDELNGKLSKWAFQIPQYKATILERKMADLLKSDQPPAPPPSMEGTTPLMPPGSPALNPPPAGTKPITVPPPKPATAPAGATGSTGSSGATGTTGAIGGTAATGPAAPTGGTVPAGATGSGGH